MTRNYRAREAAGRSEKEEDRIGDLGVRSFIRTLSSDDQSVLSRFSLVEIFEGPILVGVVVVAIAHQQFAPIFAHLKTLPRDNVEQLVLLKLFIV